MHKKSALLIVLQVAFEIYFLRLELKTYPNF